MGSLAGGVAGAVPVVAIGAFAGDSATYEGLQASRDMAEKLQAALSQREEFVWVERRHLDLAYDELALVQTGGVRQDDLLRAGRWIGADWIVLGAVAEAEPGLRVLEMEVVSVAEAGLLATTSLSVTHVAGAGPGFDMELVAERLHAALTHAASIEAANKATPHVIAPLFFECVSPHQQLDHVREGFFEQLREIAGADPDVRTLGYARIAASGDEPWSRLQGMTERLRGDDGGQGGEAVPLFLWGVVEDVDPGEAGGSAETVEVQLWLWNGVGRPLELRERGGAADADAMIARVLAAAVRRAKELEPGPQVAQEDLSNLAAEMLEQSEQRLARFRAIGRPADQRSEAEAALGRHANSLATLAGYLAPDDPVTQRKVLVNKSHYHYQVNHRSHRATWELNRKMAQFEARFPEAVDPGYVMGAVGITQYLIQDRIFLDIPRGYPRELRQEYSRAMQRQHIERLSRFSPEFLLKDTNIAEFALQSQGLMERPEDRARLIEMLWPSFVVHRALFDQDVRLDERWQQILKETFDAVGRPEAAEAMLAQPEP